MAPSKMSNAEKEAALIKKREADKLRKQAKRKDEKFRQQEQARDTEAHRLAREHEERRRLERERDLKAHRMRREQERRKRWERERDLGAHRLAQEDEERLLQEQEETKAYQGNQSISQNSNQSSPNKSKPEIVYTDAYMKALVINAQRIVKEMRKRSEEASSLLPLFLPSSGISKPMSETTCLQEEVQKNESTSSSSSSL